MVEMYKAFLRASGSLGNESVRWDMDAAHGPHLHPRAAGGVPFHGAGRHDPREGNRPVPAQGEERGGQYLEIDEKAHVPHVQQIEMDPLVEIALGTVVTADLAKAGDYPPHGQ